jgi:hypothetical protein
VTAKAVENAVAVITNEKSALTDAALSDIKSFDDALRIMQEAGVVADSMSDYGTGFALLKDKERLVSLPFIIVEWRFNNSDLNEAGFASFACITKHGDKYVVNDGSTGIADQLRSVTQRRIAAGHKTPQNGLLVPAGLTVSRYDFTDADGKQKPATTYYLSESPIPVL